MEHLRNTRATNVSRTIDGNKSSVMSSNSSVLSGFDLGLEGVSAAELNPMRNSEGVWT